MQVGFEKKDANRIVDALDLHIEIADYSVLLLQWLMVIDDGGVKGVSVKPEEQQPALQQDGWSQTESSTRVLVMKESHTQAGLGVLMDLVDMGIQVQVDTADSYTQIDGVVERSWGMKEEVPSSLFLPGLTHYHAATQTISQGETLFHRATQCPDVLYTPDQSNSIQVPASSTDANRIRVLSPKPVQNPPVQHTPKSLPSGMMYLPRPRNIHYIARGRNSSVEYSDTSPSPATVTSQPEPGSTQPPANSPRSDTENQPPMMPFMSQYLFPYWAPQPGWPWK